MATALVIGSGAVHNAWGPVWLALQDVYGNFPPSAANALFASLVYQLRWYHLPNTPPSQAERRDELLREHRHLTERIGFRLREAAQSGEICIREPLHAIIEQLVVPPWCVVTTNWDPSLRDFLKSRMVGAPAPTHLHGTSDEGSPLYLPSEMIEEPYRSEAEKARLGQQHIQALQDLEKCDRLLVYGLSFEPLDAELGVVVVGSIVHAGKLKEVVVVDVNPQPVVERLKALLLPLRPKFEPRTIVPAMPSNYRIVSDASSLRLAKVFYDSDGRPHSSLPPDFGSKSLRELKRMLRAMAKATGRPTVAANRLNPRRRR